MQTDPIGMAGGNNLYGYAEGRPGTFTDPSGLTAAAAAAAVGLCAVNPPACAVAGGFALLYLGAAYCATHPGACSFSGSRPPGSSPPPGPMPIPAPAPRPVPIPAPLPVPGAGEDCGERERAKKKECEEQCLQYIGPGKCYTSKNGQVICNDAYGNAQYAYYTCLSEC